MSPSTTLRSTLLAATGLLAPAMGAETMYAIGPAINPMLSSLDATDGSVLHSLPVSGAEVITGGLSFDPNDSKLYSIDGYNDPLEDRTFRIDPTDGSGSVVGSTGYNWNFRCVEFDPTDETLYAARDNELYTIDPDTGAATSVASITGATLNQVTALAIDASGNAYVTDTVDTGLFGLDLVTGDLTHLGDLSMPSFFRDLAFDASGTLWGLVGGEVYTIDIAQVTATLRFSGPEYRGIAFAPSSSSEPGTGYCFGDPGVGTPCPCGNDNDGSVPGSGCDNGVFASGARLEANGTASVSNDSVVLHTSGLEPNNSGLYFQADNATNGGLGVAFGDGLRCAGGGVIRLQVRSSGSSGESETTISVATKGAVAPGDVKRYQCWYRTTVNPPCGLGVNNFNLSNGYRIAWTP